MKRLALVLVAIISTALLVPNGLGAQGIAEEQHCTAKVDAERRTVAEYRCFSSFSEAISHATIGQVRLSPEAKPTRLASETFVGLQAQTVIGIDYESPGYSGQSLTWYVQNSHGCLGGWGYGVDFMPSGWNDRVSSAVAYGGCNNWRHYEHTFHGGMVRVCTCSSMGSMDNRTSSLQWSQ